VRPTRSTPDDARTDSHKSRKKRKKKKRHQRRREFSSSSSSDSSDEPEGHPRMSFHRAKGKGLKLKKGLENSKQIKDLRTELGRKRKEPSPDWIIKMQDARNVYGWTTPEYCHLLMKLYAETSAHTRWTRTLPSKMTALEAERHILSKYGEYELNDFVSSIYGRQQQKSVGTYDFLTEMRNIRDLAVAWTQDHNIISVEQLMRVVQTTSKDLVFLRLLRTSDYKPHTWEGFLNAAAEADADADLRVRTKKTPTRKPALTPSVNVFRVQDFSQTRPDDEMELDEELQARDAEEDTRRMLDQAFGDSKGHHVFQVLHSRQAASGAAQTHFRDLKHYQNVLCRERGDIPGSICPWHSCRSAGCKPKGTSTCRFRHAARKKEFCKEQDSCKLSATCPNRHKGDVYGLYILQKGSTVRWITLYDTVSPWSSFYRLSQRGSKEKAAKGHEEKTA